MGGKVGLGSVGIVDNGGICVVGIGGKVGFGSVGIVGSGGGNVGFGSDGTVGSVGVAGAAGASKRWRAPRLASMLSKATSEDTRNKVEAILFNSNSSAFVQN